jgi:probable HAF family extracellular repeat protein
MKTKLFAHRTTGVLIAALFFSLQLAGQAEPSAESVKHPRYKLIDLGTLGGPASYFSNGLDGILNNRGTAIGWANTSAHDPLDPFCFTPTCSLTHAFEVRDGVLNDLGSLPTGSDSQAIWTSGNGLIAGVADNGEIDPSFPGFTEIRGVLWRDGQMVDLGTLPTGGYESFANAVNNQGQVAGWGTNNVPDSFSFAGFPTQTRAFLWQDGTMQDLGTLGGPDAIANFINNQGDIAGPSWTPIDQVTGAPAAVHPFLWRNGAMIDLGSLGGTDSEPTAMNESGDVVGLSTMEGDVTQHPFLWRQGQLIDLGTLGGDNGTTNWINNRGDIVGRGDLAGPTPQLHDATLWRNGKIVDLGVLPGDSCSNAYYVNSHGQVVGTSESLDLCRIPTGQHAFLWEKGGPMLDLNNLIPSGAELELTFAVAINDRGEIAGFGVPPGCAPRDIELCGHAYLLIPCRADGECTNQSLPGAGATIPIPSSPARSRAPSGNQQQRLGNSQKQRFHFPSQRTGHSD